VSGRLGRLDGEVAIVTGSTSGIGAEIARVFGAEGAAVIVTGRDSDRGAAVRDAAGERATFVAADLASPDVPARLVNAAVEQFGALTVLVNNAMESDSRDGPIADVSDETWERVLTVNVVAAARLCRAEIPVMAEAGHGSIVNISSKAAQRAPRRLAAYIASKGALEALTRSIAVDYADQGIRCNTLSPGYVLNDRRDANLSDERRQQLEGMILTRLTEAHDIASAALYLASKEAEVVTGIMLPVDGGGSTARGRILG
jgi:NAD(P)-dependent dehydrogenase (short-subunit alcohol dehydrogenase family)